MLDIPGRSAMIFLRLEFVKLREVRKKCVDAEEMRPDGDCIQL
jgi:hypothetical protein